MFLTFSWNLNTAIKLSKFCSKSIYRHNLNSRYVIISSVTIDHHLYDFQVEIYFFVVIQLVYLLQQLFGMFWERKIYPKFLVSFISTLLSVVFYFNSQKQSFLIISLPLKNLLSVISGTRVNCPHNAECFRRGDGPMGSEGGKSRNVRNFFFLRQILKILFL